MIGKAIYNWLTSDTAISAIVGSRVYPELSPQQSTYPCIVYEVMDNDRNSARGYEYCTLAGYTVNIALITRTYPQTIALSNAVIAALDEGEGTYGGVVIQGAFLESESEDLITISDAQEVKYNIKELVFSVMANV